MSKEIENLDDEFSKEILKSFLTLTKDITESEQEIFSCAFPLMFDEKNSMDLGDAMPLFCENEERASFELLTVGANCWTQDSESVVLILDSSVKNLDNLDYFNKRHNEDGNPLNELIKIKEQFVMLIYFDIAEEEFDILICKYKKENNQIIFEDEYEIFNDIKIVQLNDNMFDIVSGVTDAVLHGWSLLDLFINIKDDEEDEKDQGYTVDEKMVCSEKEKNELFKNL